MIWIRYITACYWKHIESFHMIYLKSKNSYFHCRNYITKNHIMKSLRFPINVHYDISPTWKFLRPIDWIHKSNEEQWVTFITSIYFPTNFNILLHELISSFLHNYGSATIFLLQKQLYTIFQTSLYPFATIYHRE